jgi:hypothetical protein
MTVYSRGIAKLGTQQRVHCSTLEDWMQNPVPRGQVFLARVGLLDLRLYS